MARDITKLHPFVQILARQLVENCSAAGYNIKITDCVRDRVEQEMCIKNKTSNVRYPFSMHAWGLAFDICQNDAKKPYPDDVKWWKAVGSLGKELGLTWGGDWRSPVDRPHFQLDSYGNTQELLRTYQTPVFFFRHRDFRVSTPRFAITATSSKKKILWLQIQLNLHGAKLALDGVYGSRTTEAVKRFWKLETGLSCTGKRVSTACIRMLQG